MSPIYLPHPWRGTQASRWTEMYRLFPRGLPCARIPPRSSPTWKLKIQNRRIKLHSLSRRMFIILMRSKRPNLWDSHLIAHLEPPLNTWAILHHSRCNKRTTWFQCILMARTLVILSSRWCSYHSLTKAASIHICPILKTSCSQRWKNKSRSRKEQPGWALQLTLLDHSGKDLVIRKWLSLPAISHSTNSYKRIRSGKRRCQYEGLSRSNKRLFSRRKRSHYISSLTMKLVRPSWPLRRML